MVYNIIIFIYVYTFMIRMYPYEVGLYTKQTCRYFNRILRSGLLRSRSCIIGRYALRTGIRKSKPSFTTGRRREWGRRKCVKKIVTTICIIICRYHGYLCENQISSDLRRGHWRRRIYSVAGKYYANPFANKKIINLFIPVKGRVV